MRYLKGTSDYEIHYSGKPKALEVYSDSNWISDADEIKAQADMCSRSEVALFPESLTSRAS
jgi:hypothetical protein